MRCVGSNRSSRKCPKRASIFGVVISADKHADVGSWKRQQNHHQPPTQRLEVAMYTLCDLVSSSFVLFSSTTTLILIEQVYLRI